MAPTHPFQRQNIALQIALPAAIEQLKDLKLALHSANQSLRLMAHERNRLRSANARLEWQTKYRAARCRRARAPDYPGARMEAINRLDPLEVRRQEHERPYYGRRYPHALSVVTDTHQRVLNFLRSETVNP
jgi:hypothetical protein